MSANPKDETSELTWLTDKVFVTLFIAWWLLAAALLPATQDETYYLAWAQHLRFGYFDHPPLVALMAQTANLAPGVTFIARLGTVLVAAAQLWALLGLLRAIGFQDRRIRLTALLLGAGNLLGFIFGFLTTPDTVLIFAWTLALREVALALAGEPRRWLSAGFAAGLGLLAKYTMGLFVFVALWALIDDLRRSKSRSNSAPQVQGAAIRTAWPWAGALVALLVFSPHLAWNAANDWITIRFQLRHGFSLDRPDMPGRTLPEPLPPMPDSPEDKLAQPFYVLEEVTEKAERAPHLFDPILKALNRYFGFYASQIVLWGAITPLFVVVWFQRRRLRNQVSPLTPFIPAVGIAPHARALMQAAAAVPLIIFGLISLGSKVEANWSGMYVIGAAAVLAPLLAPYLKLLGRAVGINALILFIALVHARTGFLATRPHRDRVLLETHGYPQLAQHLTTLDDPIFADTFQITSMVRWYAPGLTVRQWPGITRDSEYIRSPQWSDLTREQLASNGSFWLVTSNLPPPRLPGFTAAELTQLRDCKFEGLQKIPSQEAADVNKRCKRPVHEWYLVRYLKQ